jgi:hypothetical protein
LGGFPDLKQLALCDAAIAFEAGLTHPKTETGFFGKYLFTKSMIFRKNPVSLRKSCEVINKACSVTHQPLIVTLALVKSVNKFRTYAPEARNRVSS